MLWGATVGVTGLVFGAFTALFAQLTASARTVLGYSFLALGVFFMLRAPGDMNPEMEILALISPMGLPLRTAAYITNTWWPVFAMLGIAAAVTALAFKLASIRDIDQGLIPAKPGRAYGSSLMKNPGGLTFALTRTAMIVWFVSLFVLGASYGMVLGELDTFIAGNDMYQQLILGPFGIVLPEGLPIEEAVIILRDTVALMGYTLPQLFSAMINLIMGIFVTVPAVLFILKARAEENDIRTELLIATPVSRRRYLTGFVVIAFVMAAVLQLASAIGMYAGGVSVMPDPNDFPLSFAIQVAMVYVPAIWVKVGVATLLVGLFPKKAGLIWVYFAYTFLFLFFGQGFGLFPEWVAYLSPYAFVPQLPLLPGETLNIVPLIIKLVLAAGLTAAGFYFYGKRDINAINH